jgi:hypothetical protein
MFAGLFLAKLTAHQVSLVHAVLILRTGSSQATIAGIVEVRARSPGIFIILTVGYTADICIQICISLIVANIPVIVTTMVDIVGDKDQPRTSETPPFSSIFWYRESVTTTTRHVPTEGAAVDLPMHLVGEESGDNLQLQYTKTIEVTPTPSNQNDLESEQAEGS